jgi:hypothetical protein
MFFLNILLIIYILLIIFIFINKIKSTKIAFIFLIIVGIIIIIGWNINKKNYNCNKECIIKFRKNNKKLESGIFFGSCIDYWHLLHLLLYIIIGLLMPNKYLFIFIISILWEIFEHISFKYIINSCNNIICGRIEDIFINIIGYSIGSYLTTLY